MRELGAIFEIRTAGDLYAFHWVFDVALGLADALDEVGVTASDDLSPDGFDSREMVVNRRHRDAGLASDRAERQAIDALIDQASCGLDDLEA